LANGIEISREVWTKLKFFQNSAAGDTKYVNLLLHTVFGNNTGFARKNKKEKSEKLDESKLFFIKGGFFNIVLILFI
jgi:hypothetical protein